MPDEPNRSPSNAEPSEDAPPQERAFDAIAKDRGDDEGVPPSIAASRARSAELLREASELLADRTNDA